MTAAVPSEAAVAAIVEGRHGDPFAVLGPHAAPDGSVRINVFQPDAERVEVLDRSGSTRAELSRLHGDGFFSGCIANGDHRLYTLRFTREGRNWESEDCYRFPSSLGEMDLYFMAEGSHRGLHERLGAHPLELEGVAGVRFSVWAPNARRVSVVGSFNVWDGRRNPMRLHPGAGVWELFIPGATRGDLYKFEILSLDGRILPLKADPLAFRQEAPPRTASFVHGLPHHVWNDQDWVSARSARNARSAPIAIYEVHLGSWRRGAGNSFLSYERLADELAGYVKDLGFTHIELMPVGEHPFSGSWGYQPVGLFAPTSRFGTPEEFATFVDRFHESGIGVLLDWVPAHFPSDEHGLARFDGTALYEHEDPRIGLHKDWSTLIYNYGRREVANFLRSNAIFWLSEYHADGLRVDAVASMLYLDYSRKPGEWLPNRQGGRENLDAVEFLRTLNTLLYARDDGIITVAEESTAWPQVSRPVHAGGLGFGYKWNMGWMHDTLAYMREDPINRRYHHDKLTFGLLYAWDENFVLPLSHDEVVHGKGSLLGKMPGDRWQRFANLRAYLSFMWTHPGKKLLFMGGEFGQEREWNHDHSLDWHLLADDLHRGCQRLVRDLNHLYRSIPALHELDSEPIGFSWVDGGNASDSVIAFLRHAAQPSAPVLVVCNFTPVVRRKYRVGVPFGGQWRERLNSDSGFYGGSNVGNDGTVVATAISCHGRSHSVELTLPPLGVVLFEHDNRSEVAP
jgi:1,4-alpha-glucan branching enzyme